MYMYYTRKAATNEEAVQTVDVQADLCLLMFA